MNTHLSPTALKFAGVLAGGLIVAATLAGWSRFGADILLTAAAAGLSWCF